ncbi:MAG: hypothetical protein AAGC76_05165 [Luteibacter sp.]|uniref:hypothetical protein n=1 Tax=Luteibacter sp. TaxID=1886636 RepID=UPI002806FE24|nr:hypothetical protein [Luteibacter sp.]MDQ7995227.1 hypothetical protein [Luteibacter sp.]
MKRPFDFPGKEVCDIATVRERLQIPLTADAQQFAQCSGGADALALQLREQTLKVLVSLVLNCAG